MNQDISKPGNFLPFHCGMLLYAVIFRVPSRMSSR
jgi:hypothetical protein